MIIGKLKEVEERIAQEVPARDEHPYLLCPKPPVQAISPVVSRLHLFCVSVFLTDFRNLIYKEIEPM